MIDLRDDDGLLSEALAQHVPEGGSADAEGCYALEIATPDAGHETHARRWADAGYETMPPFLDRLVDASRVLYVGRASSVRDRLEDHLAGDVRTASLPKVYEVRGIEGVRWGENTDHAERVFADDMRLQTLDDVYVHSR